MTTDLHDYSPFERHELPDGSLVFYRDSDHAYYSAIHDVSAKSTPVPKWTGVQATRLASVTTVIKPMDFNPDGLMGWACQLEAAGVAALAAEGLSLDEPTDILSALMFLQSGESIRNALTEARLLYTDQRDDASVRGTNVHKHALHQLAMGLPVSYSAMTEEERGYAHGIVQAWLDLEPEPEHSEVLVCSAKHRVAGRADLIARMDGKRVLLDAKTSTSSFVPVKHHAQLALYDLCADECGYGSTDEQFILTVFSDGSYELVRSEASHEDALAAVAVYRAAGRIGSACARARKAVAA